MKILKSALLGVAAFALLLVGILAYLAFTFDPTDFEPQITRFVKEKTGRTLHIAGEIKLSFWPDVGVRLGAASLSERDSDERFAQLESVRLTLKLLPLLARELVAEEIRIEGAQVRITRFSDGRLNVDDLLQSTGGEVQFDIARTRIEKSNVIFDDRASGRRYDFSGIALEAGRIAPRAVVPVALSFSAVDAARTFELAAALKLRLSLDTRQAQYALDDATVEVKGRVHDVTSLVARVSGSARGDWYARELTALQISGAMSGNAVGEKLDAEVHVSRLSIGTDGVIGEVIRLDARTTGAAGKARLRVALPRAEQKGNGLLSEDAEWMLDAERAAHALTATAVARFQANVEERTLEVPQFKGSFTITGPRIPRRRIEGAVSGKALLDSVRETVRVEVAGNVAGSQMSAAILSAGFSRPQYRFDVTIDELDLDRFGAAARGTSTNTSWDVSALEALPLTGTLQVGVLRASGAKARDVRVVLQ